jgi:prepilin-type N-terminal cleavage/methylation domain-containing protein
MNISRQLRTRQRGDTLVEVLICILIVSIVLMGAYVTTQRASRGIRSSQEHAEALKLAQSQLEQLRADAESEDPDVFTSGQPFCMANGEPQGSTTPQCTQDATGNQAVTQPEYRMSIARANNGDASLFTVRAEWDDINGSQARETIYYRLYQP